jgi:hypothetical protein
MEDEKMHAKQSIVVASVFALALIRVNGLAQADASNCYAIKNDDSKNHCLAIAKNTKSYCYSIHEQDTKNLCLAQLSNQKSYCYSIRSSDAKNQCLAIVR